MEWLLGGGAAVITGMAGFFGALASTKTARTGAMSVAIAAMQSHMKTLADENKVQREDMVKLRAQVETAREETMRCERDKEGLEIRLCQLEKEIRGHG